MSGDDFYDDDFNSADENSRLSGSSSRSPSPQVHSRSPSPCAGSRGYSPKSNNALLPIVEVPTSSENGIDSVQSDNTDLRRTNNSGSEDADNSDNEESRSKHSHRNKQSSGRRSSRRKSKSRKDPQHVDMTPPEKHLRKAERKAKKCLEKNKTDDGIKLLVQCTALARIVYGDGHWKLAKAYTNLAEAYIDKKDWMPQAQYHAESAKNIMLGGVHLSNSSAEKPLIMEVLITINYVLGRALTMLKKYPEAEQALNKADNLVKDYARLTNVREKDVEEWDIKLFTAIAKLSARQKKFALATTNFEKALEMMKSKYGPDAVELIPLYQSLGKVEQSKGKHANHMRAIEYYLLAHSIATANYKENSIHVAETAKALANAYSNTGDEDAEASAESYLNDCLSIYQAVYGPHHPDTIETEDELARLMIRMDRQEEGLSLLLSGIEAKKEVFGDLSTEVAETWKLIGNVHLAQGNTEKALRSLKKCYNIECSIYGTNNKKSKDTQRVIDILMANPHVAAKQKKSSSDQLKERPRFNTIVKGSQNVGGYKIPDF